MTPRERVLAAIDRRRPDRMPADLEANPPAQEALLRRLGLKTHEELLRGLEIDMRRIEAPYGNPVEGPDALGYVRNIWGVRERATDPGDGRPQLIPVFHEDDTVDDVLAHPWPDPGAPDFSGVRAACDQHRGHYALYGAPWVPFFHEAARCLGQETFYMMMTTNPAVVQAIIDRIVDFGVEVTRRFLEAAGGRIDVAYFGNDFGTQRGLVISPAMWQRYIRQPLKRYFDIAHDFGCKVMQHSCGAIRDIIPSLIEDGVDVLNPIQVRAAGMEFDGLHRAFGGRLCFYGGVDTQQLLPRGSSAQVRAQVRRYGAVCRAGGYILAGSQVLIEDIPTDNILAMYEVNLRGAN